MQTHLQYLGEMEEELPANMEDEETTPTLPLLCIPKRVLFPEETLPMHINNPHVQLLQHINNPHVQLLQHINNPHVQLLQQLHIFYLSHYGFETGLFLIMTRKKCRIPSIKDWL